MKTDKNIINDDILSILVAGIFSCIILDILGYVIKINWNSRTFMENCRKMDLLYDQK